MCLNLHTTQYKVYMFEFSSSFFFFSLAQRLLLQWCPKERPPHIIFPPSELNTEISVPNQKEKEVSFTQIMRWQRQNYHHPDALIGLRGCLIQVSSQSGCQGFPVNFLVREPAARNLRSRLEVKVRRAFF